MMNVSASRDSYMIEKGTPVTNATYFAGQLVSKINNDELLPEIVPSDIVVVKKRIPTTRTIYELNGEEINPVDLLFEKRAIENSTMGQFKSNIKNKFEKFKNYNEVFMVKNAAPDRKVAGFAKLLKRRESSFNHTRRIVSTGSYNSVIINDDKKQENNSNNNALENEQPVKTYSEILREYYMYYFGGAADTQVKKKNRITIKMDKDIPGGKKTLKKVYKKSRNGSLMLIDVIEQVDSGSKKGKSPWFASWLF